MSKNYVYVVSARWWNDDLKSRFGDEYSRHLLTDEEVINSIIQNYRAEIKINENDGSVRDLMFHNDYD